MSVAQYESHLQKLSDSFARTGVDAGTNPNELEVLCELETALRSGMHQLKLSDNTAGFNGVFMEQFRSVLFLEYLEYRKVYLSLTLDEFLEERGYVNEDMADDTDETPETDEDSAEDDYTEPVDQSEIAELLNMGGYNVATEVEEDPLTLMDLYTEPYGEDDMGFDIWVKPEEEVKPAVVIPDFSKLEEAVAAQNETAWTLMSEHYGEDALGFDIWVSFDEPEMVEEKAEELSWELLTEHYGEDSLGFDKWEPSNDTSFKLDQVEDGFDHSGDEDRVGLGELLTKFYGFDEYGFDVWSDNTETDIDKKELLTGVKTEQAGLGELLTEPRGVDSNGFDIWSAPEVQESTNNAQSSVSARQGSESSSLSPVTASHAPQLNTTSMPPARVLEEEDKMYLLLSGALKAGKKALRKFWS